MSEPEVWLRGPIPGIAPLLQPVAHSLLQCRAEVCAALPGLSSDQLCASVGGAASASYHVRHAAGSLDRLLTYARAESLSREQLVALRAEDEPDASLSPDELVSMFDSAVAGALAQVAATSEASLTELRLVGRVQLPSTVIGLLFHAAEHTQRHVGQLVTTVRIVRANA